MKRAFDFFVSLMGLLALSPFLIVICFLIWLQDFHSPFYVADRVGRFGKLFKMVKLRSMVVNADKSGVDSTSSADRRITAVGRIVRSYKLDEFSQLWNVLKGEMSLVGPRPNVKRETDLYTQEEQRLLTLKPGITDLASIVFADEGEILKDSRDPDIDYNQLIRPWKSRLALVYVDQGGFLLDLQIIWLTVLAILSRSRALEGVEKVLKELNVDTEVIRVARRLEPLKPAPPPGSDQIVVSRSV